MLVAAVRLCRCTFEAGVTVSVRRVWRRGQFLCSADPDRGKLEILQAYCRSTQLARRVTVARSNTTAQDESLFSEPVLRAECTVASPGR